MLGEDWVMPKIKVMKEVAQQGVHNLRTSGAGNTLMNKVGPQWATAMSTFGLQLPQTLRNTLMVDIETGGLSRWAPILQLASHDLGTGRSTEHSRIFPISFEKDMATFDALGNKRTPTFTISPRPIMSRSQFQNKFGSWALDKESKFGLGALYDQLSSTQGQKMRGRIESDVLSKDYIKMSDYGLQGGRYTTPRGMAKDLLLQLKSSSDKGMNFMAANNRFESARLGNVLFSMIEDPNANKLASNVIPLNNDPDIVAAFGKPLSGQEEVRRLFSMSYKFHGKHNILDTNVPEYISALSRMELKDGNLGNLISLYPELTKDWAHRSGIRNLDVLDFTRMLFSGAGQVGLTPKSADVFSGAAVNYATQMLFGREELHTALADTLDQAQILERVQPAVHRLHSMSRGLTSSSLLERIQGFAAASTGLVDSNFRSAISLAQGRFATGTFTDDALGHVYKGTALDMMKERSMHRSMAILNETLDAMLDPGYKGNYAVTSRVDPDTGKKIVEQAMGEAFTVTKNDDASRKRVQWAMKNGESFDQIKNWTTDKELYSRILNTWESKVGEDATQALKDQVRRQIERDTLDQYLKSRMFKGADKVPSLDEAVSHFDKVRDSMQSGSGILDTLTSGDKVFKANIIDTMKSASMGAGDYASFFGKKYGKYLGATGALLVGGVAAFNALRHPRDHGNANLTNMLRDGGDTLKDYGKVYAYQETGVSSIGYSEGELYKKLTQEENFSLSTKLIFQSGTMSHSYYEAKKMREGNARGAEVYVSDPELGMSSYVDVVDNQGRPSDVKTASPSKMARIRKYGADTKNVSQLNMYMYMMGVNEGTLEYINRVDPSDRELITVQFDPHRLYRDMQKLERVRTRIENELAAGILKEKDLPLAEGMARRGVQGLQEQATLERNIKSPMRMELKYRAQLTLDRFLERMRRTGERSPTLTRDMEEASLMTTANDEAHVRIEALGHSGIAWQIRQAMTDFGSGFDAVRALAKKAGQSYSDFISSKAFQEALQSGTAVSEDAGGWSAQGGFGRATLMEGKIGDDTFRYVRKTAHDEPNFSHLSDLAERATMEAKFKGIDPLDDLHVEKGNLRGLEDTSLVPTGYHLKGKDLFMEAMPGKPLSKQELSDSKIGEVLKRVKEELWSKGVAQNDFHAGNVLYDRATDRVSVIDWGSATRGAMKSERAMYLSTYLTGTARGPWNMGAFVKSGRGMRASIKNNEKPKWQDVFDFQRLGRLGDDFFSSFEAGAAKVSNAGTSVVDIKPINPGTSVVPIKANYGPPSQTPPKAVNPRHATPLVAAAKRHRHAPPVPNPNRERYPVIDKQEMAKAQVEALAYNMKRNVGRDPSRR